MHDKSTTNDRTPAQNPCRRQLMVRVNELYHDLQSCQFNEVHRRRHRAEQLFWASEVAPRLAATGVGFGVDLCTGTGFVPRILLGHLKPEAQILCIDLSARALDEARRALEPYGNRVTFHVGDVTVIPLEDGSADWVTMNAGLHHLPSPARVLGEVDRVLRPGGRFCLGHEPNAAFFNSRFLPRFERLIWHGFWYLSPSRNVKRLVRWFGPRHKPPESPEHLGAINEVILKEGLAARPLTLADLHDLVDPHTHADQDHQGEAGFHVDELLSNHLRGYVLESLRFTDYGGEMLQKYLPVRRLFDELMGRLFPCKGRLFSFVLRKN